MTEPLPSSSTTTDLPIDVFEDSSMNFQPDLHTPVNITRTVLAMLDNNNDDADHSNRSHSQYSYRSHQSSTPFFADATLDLDEAHDIAETPESVPRSLVSASAASRVQDGGGNSNTHPHLHVPSLAFLPEGSQDEDDEADDDDADGGRCASRTMTSSLETDFDINAADRRTSLFSPAQRRRPPLTRPKTLPKRPRDVGWAVAFWIIVPLGLLGPFCLSTTTTTSSASPLARHPLSTASLHTLLWSAVAAFLLSRILYLTRDGAGASGSMTTSAIFLSNSSSSSNAAFTIFSMLHHTFDTCTRLDANNMTNTLTRLAPVMAVAVACLMTGFLWWALPDPKARLLTCLASLWYILRQDSGSMVEWLRNRRRLNGNNNNTPRHLNASALPSHDAAGHDHVILASRQAFFQALLCMALEVLSRSLKRRSFYRMLLLLLTVQWCVLWLWRCALLQLLQTPQASSLIWLGLTIVAGKWATGTVARMLSLLASGGVLCWFMEQAQQLPPPSLVAAASDGAADGETNGDAAKNGGNETTTSTSHNRNNSNIPEAYRSADASVYQSVLDIDDALDDDYDVDETEFEVFSRDRRDPYSSSQQLASASAQGTSTTVKGFLSVGVTVSFGSVAQCGLLGGLAQFIWSQVRKIDAARSVIAQARQAGFQGMQIGRRNATILSRIGGFLSRISRGFIDRFSDLPMSHVATYYKSYHIAARDVALIVAESGVEQIIHDDISTHMCACVGGSIAGTIIVITHLVMVHQLKSRAEVTNKQIIENIFLSFVLSYTLLFTVMEPIRAAIKSIYISFAQHPRSVSQTYPLVYHRLHRLSENGALS